MANIKTCIRQSHSSLREDLYRKHQEFKDMANPIFDEIIRLRERHCLPQCVINDKVTWDMPEQVKDIISIYESKLGELWYSVFGFERVW